MILTGEALRRENAQAIGELLAEIGGEFVCATAGHHMEAMLAAYGSGAAKVSHDADQHILNIDIGGGTTKLALRRARQVVRDRGDPHRRPAHRGRRRGPHHPPGSAGQAACRARRVPLAARLDRVQRSELDALAEWMADTLLRRDRCAAAQRSVISPTRSPTLKASTA